MSPRTFDFYFVDMMYVEFMKNFLLADSNELCSVRLILASWAKKRLIPTFYTWCTLSSWKIFFSPIRASWWLLNSLRLMTPKTSDSYLLTWCTSCSWKIFFSPIRASWLLLDSFRPLEPKTFDSYFLDIMCVEFMKNFLLLDSSELLAVRLILAFWAKNRLIPTFLTWCTSSSWKIFFWPNRASWWRLN